MTLARFDGPDDLPQGFVGRCWLAHDRQTIEITADSIAVRFGAMSYDEAAELDFLDSIGLAPPPPAHDDPPSVPNPEPAPLPEPAPQPKRAVSPTQRQAIQAQLKRELAPIVGLIAAQADDPEMVKRASQAMTRRLSEMLTSDKPRQLRDACRIIEQTCRGIPAPIWWATPLGRACAPVLAAKIVSVAEASEIMGLSRNRVYQLINAGYLVVKAKGVTMESIVARIESEEEGRSRD